MISISTTPRNRILSWPWRREWHERQQLDDYDAINMNQFYLLALSITQGTNGIIYTNGAVAGRTTITDPIADWGTPMYWGMRPNLTVNATNGYGYTTANSGFQGYLPEVMVIHGTITPTDLTTIATNLGARYGIPVVSQEIAEQPAAQPPRSEKPPHFGSTYRARRRPATNGIPTTLALPEQLRPFIPPRL